MRFLAQSIRPFEAALWKVDAFQEQGAEGGLFADLEGGLGTLVDKVSWNVADLRIHWTDGNPIEEYAAL